MTIEADQGVGTRDAYAEPSTGAGGATVVTARGWAGVLGRLLPTRRPRCPNCRARADLDGQINHRRDSCGQPYLP